MVGLVGIGRSTSRSHLTLSGGELVDPKLLFLPPPSFSSTRRLSSWSTRWTLICSVRIVLNPLGRWFPLTPKRSHFGEAADFRSTRFLDLPSTTIYAPCDRHADRLPVKGDIPRRLALPTSLSLLPPPRPLPSYPDGLSRGLDSPTWRRSSCWRR